MSGEMEQNGYRVMDGNEALQVSGRFDAFHDALAPSCRLMRVFGPVVQARVRAMLSPSA